MLGIECLLLIPFSLKYRYLQIEERVIFAYLIASIVFAAGSYLLGFILRMNNMLFVSAMTLVQYFLLSLFYYLVVNSVLAKKIILTLTAAGVVIFVLDITVWEGTKQFNSIFAAYRNLILIGCGITVFLQLLRDESLVERSIYMNAVPLFWFNAGLFVFLCCSFLISLTYNFLQNSIYTDAFQNLQKVTRSVNFIAGTIQLILFYIGLSKIKRVRT
jgi:hypothetical protein